MRLFSLVIFIALLLTVVSVQGGNLYPRCGGDELQQTAEASTTVVVGATPYLFEGLTVTCLAFEVTSDTVAACAIAHQTDYAYRLALKATYVDEESGERVTMLYDVRDTRGGSVDNVNIIFPHLSEVSLVFDNLADNLGCVLKIRALMEVTPASNSYDKAGRIPVLVAADPPTVFANLHEETKFVLRYASVEDAKHAADDSVTLIDSEKSCENAVPKHYLYYFHNIPFIPLSESRDRYAGHKITLHDKDVGEYKLCYAFHGSRVPRQIATVTVFSGNPAYYEFIDGMDAEGHIYAHKPCTVKFHGYNLDTRPGGDSAKLVKEEEDCDVGTPAGGVPLATDLGPADDYGPNTTYTTWTFTIRSGGVFKLCYYRASGELWTEVPSVGAVGPGAKVPTSDTPEHPHPVDPATGKECEMAPTAKIKNYKVAKMVLETKTLPSDFIETLSKTFCIPRSFISLVYITSDEKLNKKVVYVNLYCDGKSCDSTERFSYMQHVSKNNIELLHKAGIFSLDALTSAMAFDEDKHRGSGGSSAWVSFMWCVTILAASGMIVYAVKQYKRRRSYMMNFGLDEADLDEMYPTAPHEGGSGADRLGGGKRIQGAVIEIED